MGLRRYGLPYSHMKREATERLDPVRQPVGEPAQLGITAHVGHRVEAEPLLLPQGPGASPNDRSRRRGARTCAGRIRCRNPAPRRLAGRSPRGRIRGFPGISGDPERCRGRHVRIRRDRRNTSSTARREHESPHRSAGLGKRAVQDCVSERNIVPHLDQRQEPFSDSVLRPWVP